MINMIKIIQYRNNIYKSNYKYLFIKFLMIKVEKLKIDDKC